MRILLLLPLLLAACNRAPPVDMAAARSARLGDFTGDAVRGEVQFDQCRTCHAAVRGVNRTGPSLAGVVGRTAGSVSGFHYSPANKASHLRWDEATLFRYLLDPQAVVPGTFMSFSGLPDPQARADVIAYLKAQR